MTFVCPIANAAVAPWQAAVHGGLMAGVVVAGAIFLVAALAAFRASEGPPARPEPISRSR